MLSVLEQLSTRPIFLYPFFIGFVPDDSFLFASMQTVLLIQEQQAIPPALRDALAQRYLLQIALDCEQARALAQKGQLMMLVLTDIHAPERLYFLRELIALEYQVLVFISVKSEALMRACVALGAHGIVDCDEEIHLLLSKIETVLTGQRTYSPELLSASLAFYVENLPSLPRSSMAALNAVLHTPLMRNVEIGRAIQLSEGRVRNIFSALFKCFSVRNRIDLVKAANQFGYFDGLALVFPRGLNVQAGQIKIVNGKKKYLIAL